MVGASRNFAVHIFFFFITSIFLDTPVKVYISDEQ